MIGVQSGILIEYFRLCQPLTDLLKGVWLVSHICFDIFMHIFPMFSSKFCACMCFHFLEKIIAE